MQVIKQSVELASTFFEAQAINTIDRALSVPYAKEAKRPMDRIRLAMERGHESVFEHVVLTLDCITNIETYKDYTRHRHCSFTIESTSFVKYKDFKVIVAGDYDLSLLEQVESWYRALCDSHGVKVARDVLPQCAAARMFMTTNIRQWRYIMKLRQDINDNPLTIELCNLMYDVLYKWSPFLFGGCR